jgi:hypothetical protein
VPAVRITKKAFTRWLSQSASVEALKKSLAAVVLLLRSEAKRTSGADSAELAGVAKNVGSCRFFLTVYFMCDALKPLTVSTFADRFRSDNACFPSHV